MGFCTQCGQPLVEGEVHACEEVAAGSAGAEVHLNGGGNPLAKKLDFSLIWNLIKNPERSRELHGEGDLIYGLIGLGASLLGLLIWSSLMSRKISSLLGDLFGFGGYGSFFSMSSDIGSKIVGKIMIIGIVSILALLASLWLIGMWRGRRKLPIKAVLTHIGGMQYTFAAGFILAGVATVINLRLSLLVLVINLFVALALTIINSSEFFAVSKEHRFSYIACSISLYFILFLLITAIVI